MVQDETYLEVGFGPSHIVLGGDPASCQKGHSPQFLAHVHCGQTAGWIKMPLGMEVGLNTGDFVLDQDHLPLKGTQSLLDHVCCGQMDGLIKIPLDMEVGLDPGNVVLDGDPALPPQKRGHSPLPLFGPCLLWPNGRPSQLLLSTS